MAHMKIHTCAAEFSHLFCSYGVLDRCWVSSCAWERDDRERLTLHISTQPACGDVCRDKELATLSIQRRILIAGDWKRPSIAGCCKTFNPFLHVRLHKGARFLHNTSRGKGHMACFYILKARKRRDGWLDYRRSLGVSEKDLKTMLSY